MSTAHLPTELLRQTGLRVTDCRLAVLEMFAGKGYALSHAELETQLTAFDRVTLYRTLGTFEEKGLLHRVLDDSGALKYALCSDGCHDHDHHHDDHVHFKCVKCGRTECLDSVRIPHLALPEGYRSQQFNLLVQGTCRHC